ncbi:hypothetical protein ACIHFE_32760 [Streptomyces sp. NPDC052396]|uniref:hypothetical protein n=1 Tax=Streptomyces sp. NPDC052396 TaxID=3365689 RepID=UPI0037D14028
MTKRLSSRTTVGFFSLTLVLPVLAGCSNGNGQSHAQSTSMPTVDQPTPTDIPQVRSDEIPQFPIESYMHKYSDEAQVILASKILIHQCMQRFGFDYAGPNVTATALASQDSDINRERRYGIISPRVAETHGYRLVEETRGAGTSAPPHKPMSDAENKIFIGDGDPSSGVKKGARYDGRPIPEGGCSGEASRTLGRKESSRTAEQINNISFARSQENGLVKKVFASWAACMRDSGYNFKSPMDPLAISPKGELSSSEITMAKTDVACKRKVNLVGTWFTVESGIQKQLIAKKEEVLAQDKKDFDSLLKEATRVGANGAS